MESIREEKRQQSPVPSHRPAKTRTRKSAPDTGEKATPSSARPVLAPKRNHTSLTMPRTGGSRPVVADSGSRALIGCSSIASLPTSPRPNKQNIYSTKAKKAAEGAVEWAARLKIKKDTANEKRAKMGFGHSARDTRVRPQRDT